MVGTQRLLSLGKFYKTFLEAKEKNFLWWAHPLNKKLVFPSLAKLNYVEQCKWRKAGWSM